MTAYVKTGKSRWVPIPKSELEYLYLTAKFQVQVIAELYGRTRQTVGESLKRYGIARRNVWVSFTCDLCRGQGRAMEKVYERSVLHFCCKSCYMDYLRREEYIEHRTGQRIGRAVMGKKLCRELRHGEVVHHIDEDGMNNDPSNLMLFKTHSEHISYHHKLRRERLAGSSQSDHQQAIQP